MPIESQIFHLYVDADTSYDLTISLEVLCKRVYDICQGSPAGFPFAFVTSLSVCSF